MAIFSPTNAKVHFKAYDGSFSDALGNTSITQNNGVAMSTSQAPFGHYSMYMANFSDSITFNTPSLFDVGTGDYTVGFWFRPTQFTSYDRLFATNTHENSKPIRIYCHNGTIQVYAEDSNDADATATDLIASYYLGAAAEDKWWHIMVRRDAGTTRLYINGHSVGSSTMSYEIDNSASPTLGADTNAAATGVKGYISDFFWTDEAVFVPPGHLSSDFHPIDPEPVVFHTGVPSNVSITPSANSVAQAGDSVTFSFAADGATSLFLQNQTTMFAEDVLGLSSKSVTITETVSYLLIAQNDEGSTQSAQVTITLGNGGNNMPKIQVADVTGLVLQKSMVDSGGGLADVMHAEDPTNGAAEDKLNIVLSNMHSALSAASGSIDTRLAADEAALAAEIAATNADVSSLDTRAAGIESDLAAEIAATDGEVSSLSTRVAAEEVRAGNAEASLETRFSDDVGSIDTRVVGVESDLNTEALARGSADSSLELRLSNEEDALAAEIAETDGEMSSMETRLGDEEAARAAADGSLETRLSTEEAALVVEISERKSADSSLELRLSNEEDALAAEIAATNSDVGSIDTRVAGVEGDLAAEIAATNADVNSIDARVAADEGALATHVANFAWDGVDTMIIGDMAKFEFETGLTAGEPMKVTITQK